MAGAGALPLVGRESSWLLPLAATAGRRGSGALAGSGTTRLYAPLDATPAPGAWWVGTWPLRCPPSWCSRRCVSPRRAWLFTPTGAASTPAPLAAPASPKPGLCPALADRAIPTTTPRPKPVGARSKPSYCPTVLRLPPSKKPAWKWPITSTPISTATAATRPSTTARPANLNTT